jgi:capsular polysaccharide biosynthesis protein
VKVDNLEPGSIINLDKFEQVGEIRVSPTYSSYPNIYQRHLIPDSAFSILNSRWSVERYLVPSVKFFLVKQAYVLAEGLVFTNSGALIAQTRTAHSEIEIAQARKNLEQVFASPDNIQTHAKAVLCKKRGANNYGHWLVEMLPKAYWAKRELDLSDWPVLVHKTSEALQSIIQQSLEVINVPNDKIIATDHAPVYFEELLIVDGLTSHAVFLSPLVLECMEFIATKADVGQNENLYAVRRPAITRDFENEPEIRQLFIEDGYREIETASLSFLEQVSTFKSAKRVVGPMGAALTNIIFCRPGTEVLVFMPASALELFFWHIAEGKKLNYHEIRCEEAGDQKGDLPWNRSLRISSPTVRNLLSRLRNIRSSSIISLETSDFSEPDIYLTNEQIIESSWAWQFSNNLASIHNVRFHQDGTISGYSHPNEKKWRVVDGVLEIVTSDGICSWRFEEITAQDGKLNLSARFRLDVNHHVVLFLLGTH